MEEASTAQVADPAERLRRGGEALAMASAGRKASLQAILVETRSVDIMADTTIEMAIAVRLGLAGAEASSATGAEIRAGLSARRPQLVARYGQWRCPPTRSPTPGSTTTSSSATPPISRAPAAEACRDASVRGVARALADGAVKLARCLKDAAAKP